MNLLKRLFCLHYYVKVNPCKWGSYGRGVYQCKLCAKVSFAEHIPDWCIVDPTEFYKGG